MSKTTNLAKKSLFWAHRALVAQQGGLGVILAQATKYDPTPDDLQHWQRECALFAKAFSDWHRSVCELLGTSPYAAQPTGLDDRELQKPLYAPAQPVDLDEADDGPEPVDAA